MASGSDGADQTPVLREGDKWRRFSSRLAHLLLVPGKFWESLREEHVSVREMMLPHLILLIGVRAVAGFIGSLLGGGGFGAALGALISSFVSWFALVWVFAIVAASLASAKGGRLSANDSLRLAAYGLAPLFLVGVFAVIPFPHVAPIAELIAMPYAFYVLSAGVVPMLGVPVERAPVMVGQLCGALLILWSIMPTLLPELVRVIAG